MNANKVIHEARGYKWRELTTEKRKFNVNSPNPIFMDTVCKCCDGPQSGCNNINPDYTSPVAYCELMEWMQNKDRAENLDCFVTSLGYIDLDDWLKLTRKKQVILIAEAIQAGALK